MYGDLLDLVPFTRQLPPVVVCWLTHLPYQHNPDQYSKIYFHYSSSPGVHNVYWLQQKLGVIWNINILLYQYNNT